MRERAIIHVAGPKDAGKTALVEHLLHGFDGFVLAARCIRDDTLKESKETAPKNNSELRRYIEAGACGTAVFAFPSRNKTLARIPRFPAAAAGENPLFRAGVSSRGSSPAGKR